jgi:hypothetical protein
MKSVGQALLAAGGAHKPTHYDFGNDEKIDIKGLCLFFFDLLSRLSCAHFSSESFFHRPRQQVILLRFASIFSFFKTNSFYDPLFSCPWTLKLQFGSKELEKSIWRL